ncbi:MAG: ATP-dependent DNA helicase RecG [Bacteroidales bacterium]|nr:ATP-dependent DNA helicase RecG [Bacteroidales bacterium]MBN2750819.1 ATP-dependent DNA helicase RecG [Bacteroidales bacterium]
MAANLTTNIKYLPGVGPKRAELLQKELQISTVGDLIYYFPFKYVDRSKVYKVADLVGETAYVQVIGRLVKIEEIGDKRSKRLVALLTDGTGVLELVWFKGAKWVMQNLKKNVDYLVFGKPTVFNGRYTIAHPELEELSQAKSILQCPLQAAYNTSERLKNSNLNSKTIFKLQQEAAKLVYGKLEETLPAYMLEKHKLLGINEALKQIHFPDTAQLLQKAQYRLKFDELFYLQLGYIKQRSFRQSKVNGHVFGTVGNTFNLFFHKYLPFELTGAQKRVIKEIRRDMGSGKQMNRLLQGDVGSGKTLVALMCMLIAVDNGYQACLMAPTEILATQHYISLSAMLANMPVEISLLTGSTKKSQRNDIHQGLLSGKINLLIGTHALLEDIVQFQNLGLVVIDEQQRFGVMQRARLWEKNNDPPHVLVMTATPIPRTLAMTAYGDLEVSVIDELPPGRKPIKTVHYMENRRNAVYGLMREQIKLGRQVYVVYPLIKESEKMENLRDLEEGYQSITELFPPPQYVTVIVHGQMKPDEKEKAMQLFVKGKAHIMVATTVIEVGVNVPNASVMVIESAERFGLSQLHQLRGRVGRGADESFCVLLSSVKLSNESRKRLETMVATNDGFEIAEADLLLRGPGDIEGTQQSGIPFDFKIANLSRDAQLLQYVRNIAEDIIEDDPLLTNSKNAVLVKRLTDIASQKLDFSRIS